MWKLRREENTSSVTLAAKQLESERPLVKKPSLRRMATSADVRALSESARPTPSPEMLGTTKKKSYKTPHHHALQEVHSYSVSKFDLDESVKSKRPRVFVKTLQGKKQLARYGEDMFQKARVHIERPLLVVRQNVDGDVVVSSLQAMDWLSVLSENPEDTSNETLQIVPAGSFSYRKSFIGATVRLLMNLHTNANPARIVCCKKYPPVRLACVVIPRVFYRGKHHLVITQRVMKSHGTYNNMYCFPGGHVESGETLEEGASRECFEETGLEVEPDSLRLRCCWQEVLPPKNLQFLMLVYSADVVSKSNATGEFDWNDVMLQKEEVAKLALIPEDIWQGVATRADVDREVEALISNPKTGTYERGTVSANEITGFHAGFGSGIGSGHRYALLQYLDPFDKHVVGEDSAHPASNRVEKSLSTTSSSSSSAASSSSSSLSSSREGGVYNRPKSMRMSLNRLVLGPKISQQKKERTSRGSGDSSEEEEGGSELAPSANVVEMSPRLFQSGSDADVDEKIKL